MGATFALVPSATSVAHLAAIFALGAACSQGVAIGGHALIARQLGAGAGPGLNGINAAFGAGSLLAPMAHAALAPAMQPHGGAASYWPVAALLCVAAVPFAIGSGAEKHSAHAEAAAAAAPREPSTSTLSVSGAMRALRGRDGAMLTAAVMGLVTCCVGAEARKQAACLPARDCALLTRL